MRILSQLLSNNALARAFLEWQLLVANIVDSYEISRRFCLNDRENHLSWILTKSLPVSTIVGTFLARLLAIFIYEGKATQNAILTTLKTSLVPIYHERHSRSYDFLYIFIKKLDFQHFDWLARDRML